MKHSPKLILDTNIILDVLLSRADYFDASKAVLSLCEAHVIEGFITASSLTDIFYITRRALHSTDDAYQVIGSMLNIVRILTVTNTDVQTAFIMRARDFEDCLLAVCAKSNQCEGIVTRNKDDFVFFGVPLYSPEELLSLYSSTENNDG